MLWEIKEAKENRETEGGKRTQKSLGALPEIQKGADLPAPEEDPLFQKLLGRQQQQR